MQQEQQKPGRRVAPKNVWDELEAQLDRSAEAVMKEFRAHIAEYDGTNSAVSEK